LKPLQKEKNSLSEYNFKIKADNVNALPHSTMEKNEAKAIESFVYSSNPLQLNSKDWIIVLSIVVFFMLMIPFIWQKAETFEPILNYRMPRSKSQDYWLFRSFASVVKEKSKIAVIGDSAVWGHYVSYDQTLSAIMNKKEGSEKYVNLGVSGLHSSALNGIINYYGNELQDCQIIIQFAPLWIMNSKKDLSDPDLASNWQVNHPKLLDQFNNKPPQYSANLENRLTISVARELSVFSLTEHWTSQSTEGQPFSKWMVLNPYSNPLSNINLNINGLPEGKNEDSDNRHWKLKPGIIARNIKWVSLKDSYQWKEFIKVIHRLKDKNNKIFVFLGPFNIHMLTDESLNRYRKIQEESRQLLLQEGIAFYWAKDMSPTHYGDESHPLVIGYEELAEDMLNTIEFKNWIKGGN
jgi:hypothetical protein